MSDDLAAYEQLVELIEQELELAGLGRFDELADGGAERAALMANLPAVPPPGAHTPLERAALLQQRLTVELLRARETLLRALSDVERGRRTVRGYGPPTRSAPRLTESA
jgi:hypothetical protein